MQSILDTTSEAELEKEIFVARRQRYQQVVPHLNSRNVEVSSTGPLASHYLLEAEKPTNQAFDQHEDYRHWSPISQPYAPADILIQYIRDGWLLADKVIIQVTRCYSGRCVEVYHFRLTSDHEQVVVAVIANPVVLRLVMEHRLLTFRIYVDDVCSELF